MRPFSLPRKVLLPSSADVRGCTLSVPATTLLVELRSPLLLVPPVMCGRAAHWSNCGRASQLRCCQKRARKHLQTFFCAADSTRLGMLRMRRFLWSTRSHFGTERSSVWDSRVDVGTKNLHSISALLLPLNAYRPPRCLALPKILPKGINAVSCL